MKNMTKLFAVMLALLLGIGFGYAQSYDYENMDMDTYKAELAKWQQREAQIRQDMMLSQVS